MIKTDMEEPITSVIRKLDEQFGTSYFTLKDVFLEERRKILNILMKDTLNKFSNTYQEIYDENKGSIYHLQSLGMKIPDEFKIAAQYNLTKKFNNIIQMCGKYFDDESIEERLIKPNQVKHLKNCLCTKCSSCRKVLKFKGLKDF